MSRRPSSTDAFQAISDPTRRELLDRLSRRISTVNELSAGFDMSRPAISKHLRVLLQAHLVSSSKQGRMRFYTVQPEKLRDISVWIESYRRFWEANLSGLKAHLEKSK
jgi:DNA-binding transcriptional ArsR family regulator